MRLMYLHAYQSFVWNEATSKRLELHGLSTCIGDLVKDKNEKEVVTILSEENISQFSIYDVVLPLPGHNIIYPNNESRNKIF